MISNEERKKLRKKLKRDYFRELIGRPDGEQGWEWYFGYALGVVVTIISVGVVMAILGTLVIAIV